MKFLTIDNQPLIQFGLQSMIEKEFPGAAISQFEDRESALRAIRSATFDLIFLGIQEGEDDVISWIGQVKSASPKSRLIIYKPLEEEHDRKEDFLHAGADDVVLYRTGLDDISDRVHALLRSGQYLPRPN